MMSKRRGILQLVADSADANWSGIGVAARRQHDALRRVGANTNLIVVGERGSPQIDEAVYRLRRGKRFPVDPRGCRWLHLHSLGLTPLALELKRRFGMKLVYTVHGQSWGEPLFGLPDRTRRYWIGVQHATLGAADRVVFLCADEREAALARYPMLAGRSCVIPHGIRPCVRTEITPPGAPVVFAGRYALSKGLELLAEAVPMILARYPGTFQFLGGHGDPTGQAVVDALCTAFPGRCVDLGWRSREDVDAVLAAAALVLMPSKYEPFGLVALEAMALGTPVVGAAVGGLRAQLSGEAGGVSLDSRKPAVWAEQALAILLSPRRHTLLSRRGPLHVRKHFHAADIAAKLIDEIYAT